MERTYTAAAIAAALREGVYANFTLDEREKELEKLMELFLDMAMSIEMIGSQSQTAKRRAWLLADIADCLDGHQSPTVR